MRTEEDCSRGDEGRLPKGGDVWAKTWRQVEAVVSWMGRKDISKREKSVEVQCVNEK